MKLNLLKGKIIDQFSEETHHGSVIIVVVFILRLVN
jgi:hypothetical protein